MTKFARPACGSTGKRNLPSFDFDRYIDRSSTTATKWIRFPEGVLPFWVADMDFAAPDFVLDAICAWYGIRSAQEQESVREVMRTWTYTQHGKKGLQHAAAKV